MLKADTEVKKRRGERLREAITAAVKDGVTSVTEIAAECTHPETGQKGISPKAVYGWYKTGSISKENLFTVERLTEYSSQYITSGVLPKKVNLTGGGQLEGSPRAQVLASMFDNSEPEERRRLWPQLLRLFTRKRRGTDEVRETVAQSIVQALDELGPATVARLLSDHAIQLEKQAKLGPAKKAGRVRKRVA